jgi:hypothetical protein
MKKLLTILFLVMGLVWTIVGIKYIFKPTQVMSAPRKMVLSELKIGADNKNYIKFFVRDGKWPQAAFYQNGARVVVITGADTGSVAGLRRYDCFGGLLPRD